MMLTTLHAASEVLAQIGNPTPEAPPESDRWMKLVRYLVWLAMVLGVLAVFGAVIAAVVLVIRRRSRPKPPQGPYGPR
ncbi:hypothetical protein GFY24_07480 [Nocardia sp. SYP-A9097]|uniref:hypothetical protein n=1 Tax=Nocardia sp. SYP-A9097 TaxID=2663237 RepID=UPI00129B09ED|nr:hypothetical protein [Nocardia sp. SYP-A9097]MRH87304.1 hypothetical protein [Nocardia sp. SYP-A9097]